MAIEDPKPRRAETTSDAKFEKIKDAFGSVKNEKAAEEGLTADETILPGDEVGLDLDDGIVYRVNELGLRISFSLDGDRQGLLVSAIDPASSLVARKASNGVLIEKDNPVVDESDTKDKSIGPVFNKTETSPVLEASELRIDLSQARGPQRSGVYFGQENGNNWRDRFQLDKLERADAKIVIVVPEDTIAFDITFFFGLFGRSVRNYGKDGFLNKYDFKCTPEIREQVGLGIEQSLHSYYFAFSPT